MTRSYVRVKIDNEWQYGFAYMQDEGPETTVEIIRNTEFERRYYGTSYYKKVNKSDIQKLIDYE